MYLADTSVWINALRGNRTVQARKLDELLALSVPCGLTGVIFQELLQGAGSEDEWGELQDHLSVQRFYHLKHPIDSFEAAARLYFRCRRRGVTPRSAADCLIAQAAIEHDLILLHEDQDFDRMAAAIPELKVE